MKTSIQPIKIIILLLLLLPLSITAQKRNSKKNNSTSLQFDEAQFKALKFRNIGPFRGGRSVASSGVVSDLMTYYMGSTGGGVWKTLDGGISWKNISDKFFKTGTVGAIAVSESDPNVIFVGMGEHAIRGVMTSSGDGVYKSTDAGKTWKHVGLDNTMHISDVIIHPQNPDIVYVAAQGAQYGDTKERGIYKTEDGGENWKKVLFVSENTGASSLSMDFTNPRILYASMWEHQRYPWIMKSGGKESGIYKSTDSGNNWKKLETGLPDTFGKSGISVSRANPNRVWAVIEAEGEKGGVYRSDNAGKKWKQINKNRINIARSWYYMEIFADPQNENVVYVLNAPVMKSIDGGTTFKPLPTPHGDNHHLWINPNNNQVMINSNDGGANISFNGGKSWSTQQNQPTAQFYRVITDNLMPYNVYGGQQDNSAIAIASRTNDNGIDWKDWYSVAGCESAYLAFDPNHPDVIYGGCYQGIIEQWVKKYNGGKSIKEYPELGLGIAPKDSKYRYNWNAPIISSPHDRNTIYHAGNVVFKTQDGGMNWEVVSPDLTRNEKSKHGPGGGPFTNEAAGGENYNTITYLVESPHEQGVLWAGTDDGLIHITKDGGLNWKKVSPKNIKDGIINTIEVSPHDAATAYIVVMRYKSNDLKPYIYKSSDYGTNWKLITNGINDPHTFVRVIREDPKIKGLLYAGTETGLYISNNDGENWQKFQLNLPIVPINDLIIQDNDLVVATAGRSFWILDDLSAIQQSKGKFSTKTIEIFTPKNTYRIFGNSSEKPGNSIGQNPKQGVTFDYYLNQKSDSLSLILKVFDLQENLIRTITNKKQKDFKSWPGGPSKPAVLPSKKGLNRFTWDFRRETLPSIDKVFVFGGHQGSRVAPGDYKLRLILEKDSVETIVTILPNPKIKATASDFNQQQTFLQDIETQVKDIHNAVNAMRSAKAQLKSYQLLLKENKEANTLLEKAEIIIDSIDSWEQKLIQPKQKTFQDVINFNNQLNAQFMHLKNYVDAADPRLTSGAKLRLADLKQQWQVFSSEKNTIVNEEMKAFNDLYNSLNLPALIMEN
ncbi:glycosyl hydrolase [Flavobacteriaceae bacterium PRS1]|nr:glycosyl hydrolase [Flavobacteriaceae bacterium PRS1]